MKEFDISFGIPDRAKLPRRERRNQDGDMTILSMHQLLRRCVLLVALSAMASCTTVGKGITSDSGVPSPPLATAPETAKSSPETSRLNQASAENTADSKEKKAESVRIFKGTGVLLQPPANEVPSTEPADVSLNFESADIREIAKTVLAEILRESYIVDPKVQGLISFRTTRPLPKSALLPTLETVLRMNGIVIVKENGIFKIMPASTARGSLSPRLGGVFAGYSVQVVPLKFIGSREMAKILESFALDASAVKVDEMRNLLILSGTQNELRHMQDTVDMFDVDWLSGMSVGLFTMQSADVKTVDAELTKIFGDKSLNPLAGVVRLVPIERLNSFLIITPQPQYLEQAKIWLERLDRAGGSGGGARLFVYHVRNGKAEHLADMLNQVFSGGKSSSGRIPSASVAPGLTPANIKSSGPAGNTAMSPPSTTATIATSATSTTLTVTDDGGNSAGEVRIIADKDNNALLILATAAGYEKIEAALKKLDTAPRQVLIEVTIAEVTLKDELEYGLEWLFFNGPRKSGQLDMGTAGLNKLVPGFSYAITTLEGGSIQGILNMLASNNKLNVLSSPHIMVADNQVAKIQVGDSVPTAGPQSIGAAGVVVSSVQYLDTGVILSVTPHINAGGLVGMDIDQEVSTASRTGTSSLNSPTISKRTAKTTVSVQSGETMVLGGLISENSSNGSSGVPFLSTIPIVGGLFGTKSRNNIKTELIVLITPRVANNVGQAKVVSDEFRKRMKEAEELLKCGTSNEMGYTTRAGMWCLQPTDGLTSSPSISPP